MEKLSIHPAAAAFPMMDDASFAELRGDIATNGLRDPIVLWRGQLLDGRNRLKACEELGIVADEFSLSSDTDPVAYVISTNLHRRHLTPSQKAAIAAELLPELEKRAKERQRLSQGRGQKGVEKVPHLNEKARDEAAKIVGVNPRYVSDAKAIKEKAPELHEEMKQGKVTLTEAKRTLGKGDAPKATIRAGISEMSDEERVNAVPADSALRPLLDKLLEGAIGAEELRAEFPHYRARISDLRDKYLINVRCVRTEGVTIYSIGSGKPKQDADAPVEKIATAFAKLAPQTKHAAMRKLLRDPTMAEYRRKQSEKAARRGETVSENIVTTLTDARNLLHSVVTTRTGPKRQWANTAEVETLSDCLRLVRGIERHNADLVSFFEKEFNRVHS